MPPTTTTPAKINLYLDVTGRRADGYHEIHTLFLPVHGLTDTVGSGRRRRHAGLALTCRTPGVPTDHRNLVWRAAAAFAAAAALSPDWRLSLRKRIPVAAGLGGGSSDAAAVLRLLNDMHGQPLPPLQLARLAAGLGADVAFFLDPRPCRATGIGEVLTPVPCPVPLDVVLLNPGFPIPAAWAYAHLNRVPRPAAPPPAAAETALARHDLQATAEASYNALEYAVLDKFPLLAMLREYLLEAGCLAAHVSGSGPTVFGILPAPAAAEPILRRARRRFGRRLWVFAGQAG